MTAPKTIHLVMATRPNFMKAAPLYHTLKGRAGFNLRLVHTGQHYDENMSGVFLRQLKLPEPDFFLNVGSSSHAQQTAAVMVAYEALCLKERPDLTIVIGDVNSTVAAALTASKLHIPVAHLEAGLRSFDKTMPEEINRIVTDVVSDIFWTPSRDADENLLREGKSASAIRCVGNIMMDSYELMRPEIEAADECKKQGLEPGRYGTATLHRPGNVDAKETLEPLLRALGETSRKLPIIWPLHPRTKSKLDELGLQKLAQSFPGIYWAQSLGYVEFMSLVKDSAFVVTDSGGVQEETSYLGIPCLTLRPNTERPVTITQGTNRLVTPATLASHLDGVLANRGEKKNPPPLWDGKTAARIVAHLEELAQTDFHVAEDQQIKRAADAG